MSWGRTGRENRSAAGVGCTQQQVAELTVMVEVREVAMVLRECRVAGGLEWRWMSEGEEGTPPHAILELRG